MVKMNKRGTEHVIWIVVVAVILLGIALMMSWLGIRGINLTKAPIQAATSDGDNFCLRINTKSGEKICCNDKIWVNNGVALTTEMFCEKGCTVGKTECND